MSRISARSRVFTGVASPPEAAMAGALRRTRWPFLALCGYLLAQAYMIPLYPIGPSWGVWPTLADLLWLALVLTTFLALGAPSAVTTARRRVLALLLVAFGGCALSSLIQVAVQPFGQVIYGLFYLYRLIQAISIFWAVSRLPLSPGRVAILKRVVDVTLLFVCVTVFLTYFRVLPLAAITAHLPKSPSIAGPWNSYSNEYYNAVGQGWGTISYNHGYVALQLIMLLGLGLHLSMGRRALTDNLLVFLTLGACFVSESRNGLASLVAFILFYWVRKPLYMIALGIVGAGLALALLFLNPNVDNPFLSATIERQQTVLSPEDTENLSGRDSIWDDRLTALNEQPIRWISGQGFGFLAGLREPNAHLLYLQIVAELGLLGLIVFGLLATVVLRALLSNEGQGQPLFWLTVALLISSLSQETFYPVIAFGHFLGLYLASLALALRAPGEVPLAIPAASSPRWNGQRAGSYASPLSAPASAELGLAHE